MLLAKHIERAFELLDIIHGDAYEPLTVQAKGGYSYCIIFLLISIDMIMCFYRSTSLNYLRNLENSKLE